MATSRPRTERLRFVLTRTRSFLSAAEPLGMLGIAAWVYLWIYLSFLNRVEPSFTWLGLAVASFPFLWRLVRQGYRGIRTPFDIPIGLMVMGAGIGVWVSPNFNTSLGAFQCLIAATLAYYSFCHHPRPGALVKVTLPLAGLIVLAATLLALSQTPLPVLDSLSAPWMRGLTHHIPLLPQGSSSSDGLFGFGYGLALAQLVIFAFCMGFVLFGRRVWLRLGAGLGCLLFAAALALTNYSGLSRLIALQSIFSRLPLWQLTLDMLAESPLTGLGLGTWFFSAQTVLGSSTPGHPHNAYLELYSNTGMFGVLAFLGFLVVAVKLGWNILRSPRSSPWYGFGVGTLLAIVCSALDGIVEKAPLSIIVLGDTACFYVFSPLPWLLGAALVLAHRLLKDSEPQRQER